MTHDRHNGTDFMLTQDFLAPTLGVGSEVAAEVPQPKLIPSSRGLVRVLNRRGLEKRSCGCYFIVRNDYDRLSNKRRK